MLPDHSPEPRQLCQSHDDDEPLERPYQPESAQFAGAAGAAELEDDAAEPVARGGK